MAEEAENQVEVIYTEAFDRLKAIYGEDAHPALKQALAMVAVRQIGISLRDWGVPTKFLGQDFRIFGGVLKEMARDELDRKLS